MYFTSHIKKNTKACCYLSPAKYNQSPRFISGRSQQFIIRSSLAQVWPQILHFRNCDLVYFLSTGCKKVMKIIKSAIYLHYIQLQRYDKDTKVHTHTSHLWSLVIQYLHYRLHVDSTANFTDRDNNAEFQLTSHNTPSKSSVQINQKRSSIALHQGASRQSQSTVSLNGFCTSPNLWYHKNFNKVREWHYS